MKSRFLACAAVTALTLTFAGCAKKVASTPKPPPPPAQQNTSSPAPATTARQNTYRPAETASNGNHRMPDAATRARIQDLLNRIQDAYFDFDKHNLRPDAETALMADAKELTNIIKQYPDFKLTVEGHCDERGSEEYNMALGDARAKQTQEYLATLGLPGDQLRTVSFGKEKPVCSDHTEECWQKNRRAHITQAQAE